MRVIYPNIPNRATPRAFFDHMIKAGVQVIRYTNFRTSLRTTIMRVNYQDHRKIAVIDGQVAYTGGMNLNDNYFYHWRDTHLRIEGPAVHALDAAFLDTFMSSAGRITRPLPFYFPDVVPAGEGKTLQIVTDAAEYPFTAAEHAYLWILDHARDYVYLQTPYFMPPEPVLAALKGAALRGVDVRVMLPKEVDTPFFNEGNASYYEECVQAGIKIFIRGGEFIHSKTLVCDDCLAVIGASNLDHRSFRLNNEVNTFIYDRDTALRCKEIFLEDGGEPLDIQKWRKERTIWSRILSAIMRMLSFNM